MVYITIHRPDAIPRLLQLGADLVHGVVKGAGQAVEGFAVCPAEVKKCEKDGGVSCQAGAELV